MSAQQNNSHAADAWFTAILASAVLGLAVFISAVFYGSFALKITLVVVGSILVGAVAVMANLLLIFYDHASLTAKEQSERADELIQARNNLTMFARVVLEAIRTEGTDETAADLENALATLMTYPQAGVEWKATFQRYAGRAEGMEKSLDQQIRQRFVAGTTLRDTKQVEDGLIRSPGSNPQAFDQWAKAQREASMKIAFATANAYPALRATFVECTERGPEVVRSLFIGRDNHRRVAVRGWEAGLASRLFAALLGDGSEQTETNAPTDPPAEE